MLKIPPSELTPESMYLSRREFMKGLGVLAASTMILAACNANEPSPVSTSEGSPSAGAAGDDLGDPLTSYEAITNYNNYYEFSTGKHVGATHGRRRRHPHPLVLVRRRRGQPKTYDVD